MESELSKPTAHEASRILQEQEKTEERAARYRPSRSYVLFQLWSAAVLAIYLAAVMLAYSGREAEGESRAANYVLPLMLYPILAYNMLERGTREKFGVRSKPATPYRVSVVIVAIGLLAIFVLTMAEVAYPWWLNLLLPALIFVVEAFSPLRLLRRAETVEGERWENRPLSAPVRWTTTCLGLVAGALAASATQPWFYWMHFGLFAVFLVGAVGIESKWGLPQVGFEWGLLHWAFFGAVLGVLFALTLLLALTELVTTGVAVATGVVIAAAMIVAALLPANRD